MQAYNETATQELVKLVGRSVTRYSKEGFLKNLKSALNAGANPNVTLIRNEKVNDEETPIQYYRRRAAHFEKLAQQGADHASPEGADLGEDNFNAQCASIATEIAEILETAAAADRLTQDEQSKLEALTGSDKPTASTDESELLLLRTKAQRGRLD